MSTDTTPREATRLLETARHFVRTFGFNAHQLDSFNWFAEQLVGPILDAFEPITCMDVITPICTDIPVDSEDPPRPDQLTIKVTTRDAYLEPSTQEPAECLSRQLDYVCTLRAVINVEIRLRGDLVWSAEYRDFRLGWIPAMVLSRQCKVGLELFRLQEQWRNDEAAAKNVDVSCIPAPAASLDPKVRADWRKARGLLLAKHRLDMSDPGGHWIARGAEKVVVIQERLTNSSVYVFPPDDKSSTGTVCYTKPIIAECFDKHTRILTDHGFLFVHELKAVWDTVKISNYNPDTKSLEYHAPIGNIIEPEVRPRTMVQIEHDNVSLLVTEEHDVYCQRTEAAEFSKMSAKDTIAEESITLITMYSGVVKLNCARDISLVKDYNEPVWCLTVPTGLVVVQRAWTDESGTVTKASRPVVAGNCRSHLAKQFKQEMFSMTWSAVPNRPIQVIRAVMPKFRSDFPLFVLMRAMLPLEPDITTTVDALPTFQTAEEVARLLMMFCNRPNQMECFRDLTLALEHSEREAHGITTTRQCLYYIGQRCKLPEVTGTEELTRSISIQQTILKEIFPHLTDSPLLARYSPVPTKLHFMLFMLYRLLAVVLKWEPFDDRDHYGNKRMDTTGSLLKIMYRQIMIRQTREIQKLVVTSCKSLTQKKARTTARGVHSTTTTTLGGGPCTFQQLLDALKIQLSRECFERWWTPTDSKGKYVMGIIKEFSSALITGNWNKQVYASAVASSVVLRSVSQYYKRSNYVSQISEQRRVNLPEDENVGFMKHMALSLICSPPLDVDDIHDRVMKEIGPLQIEEPVNSRTLLPVPLTWILLNGNILGAVPFTRRYELYENIRTRIKISIEANRMMGVSLQRMGRILSVQTDEGRCCRPLVSLKHIHEWLTPDIFGLVPFNKMMERGWLEWMDVAETMQHAVATNWTFLNDLLPSERSQYHYMELHPSLMASFSASIMPFSNMCPGPRVAYAASMASSAIGAYGTNMVHERDDSLFDNLHYPQKSLTPTTWATEAFCHELPTFQNAVVAILSYGGDNQEDAVIVNRSSVDLGMFTSTRYRSFRDTSSCQSSLTKEYMARQQNRFGAPDNEMRPPSVDVDGLAIPGFKLQEGDVLMHKQVIKEKIRLVDEVLAAAEPEQKDSKEEKEPTPPSTTTKAKRKPRKAAGLSTQPTTAPDGGEQLLQLEDVVPLPMAENLPHPNVRPPKGKKLGELMESMTTMDSGANASNSVKFHDPSIVDRVMVTESETGDQITKVRTRSVRRLQIGNKLASQGPQKGVVGSLRSREDMPFFEDGTQPDLCLVTHSIPSRMTVSQLMSMLAGTVACMTGKTQDSTAFQEGSDIAHQLAKSMLQHGFTPDGSRTMYDHATGLPLEAEVFVGVTTYQAMRQQTVDKYHVRGRGQVQLLTRQPTEGKATSGGLRLGEMERDGHINHGLSHFLSEKFGKDSDGDITNLCPKCHTLHKHHCPEHPDLKADIVHVPQAFSLLISELRAMNINAQLIPASR